MSQRLNSLLWLGGGDVGVVPDINQALSVKTKRETSKCLDFCYNGSMEEQLQQIKAWLGTGSINIFGLPMSGKDTVGVRLAEALGAKFLSSGIIVRAMEEQQQKDYSHKGALIPSGVFYDWVLPYFELPELKDYPLILSSIGRWKGEEDSVMNVARNAGHPIMAVVNLQLTEQEVYERWEAAKLLGDRGLRADDIDKEVFARRIAEFKDKTLPVLKRYHELGILIQMKADGSKDQVFIRLVETLAQFAQSAKNLPPILPNNVADASSNN